jgi:hypothetical protein
MERSRRDRLRASLVNLRLTKEFGEAEATEPKKKKTEEDGTERTKKQK